MYTYQFRVSTNYVCAFFLLFYVIYEEQYSFRYKGRLYRSRF